MNTLGNRNTSSTVYKNREKTFDFHQHHPNKRQKTGTGTHSNPLLVDSERRNSQGSGLSQSQSRNSLRVSIGEATEFKNVENQMRPYANRRRTSQQSTTPSPPMPILPAHGNSNPRMFKQPIQAFDDANDQIVDHDTPKTRNTRPEVVIPPQKQPYQGSANRAPPRDKDARGKPISRKSNEAVSRYFPVQEPNSLADADELSDELSQSQAPPQFPGRKKLSNTNFRANPQAEVGDSEDELANEEVSDDNKVSVARASYIMQKFNGKVDDDESALDRTGDMKSTNFSLRKTKGTKASEAKDFQVSVMRIISGARIYLDPQKNFQDWSLRYDHSPKLLKVYDENGKVVEALGIPLYSIKKITYSPKENLVVIEKARGTAVDSAGKIFFECHQDIEATSFAERMAELGSEIVRERPLEYVLFLLVFRTSADHIFRSTLRKTFLHAEKTAKLRMQQNPKNGPQADDIQLAEANSIRRANDKRRSSTSLESTQAQIPPNKKQKLSEGMRPASQELNPRESEDEPQFKNPGIPPDSFYGSSRIGVHRRETRSSAMKRPAKPRTPSPEPWTRANRGWANEWHSSITYPKEGKHRATVDKEDIPRLNEGEFLNDNLIMFYLLWLQSRLNEERPDLAKRIYFFNTFFYQTLTKAGKGKRTINYEAVERWTSKVDLLSFDYIIVPVNEHTHWYLAIICNAPKLLISKAAEDPTSEESARDLDRSGKKVDGEVSSSPLPSSPKICSPRPSDFEVGAGIGELSLQDKPSMTENQEELGTPGEKFSFKYDGLPKFSSEIGKSKNVEGSLPPTTIKSNLQDSHTPKGPLAKKGRRKSSAPTPRKYNPKAPRIITLDSLGHKHYVTSSNLKQYLLAEIKAKKGHEIPDPGSLGMAAMNIPEQNNHCDCGIFLLNYVEEFLKRPDEFIRGILENSKDFLSEWTEASTMRNNIRNILFGLQKQQAADAINSKQSKSKKKVTMPADGKIESSTTSQPGAREASKSTRTSSSPGSSSPDKPVAPETPSAQLTAEMNAERVPRSEHVGREVFDVEDDQEIVVPAKYTPRRGARNEAEKDSNRSAQPKRSEKESTRSSLPSGQESRQVVPEEVIQLDISQESPASPNITRHGAFNEVKKGSHNLAGLEKPSKKFNSPSSPQEKSALDIVPPKIFEVGDSQEVSSEDDPPTQSKSIITKCMSKMNPFSKTKPQIDEDKNTRTQASQAKTSVSNLKSNSKDNPVEILESPTNPQTSIQQPSRKPSKEIESSSASPSPSAQHRRRPTSDARRRRSLSEGRPSQNLVSPSPDLVTSVKRDRTQGLPQRADDHEDADDSDSIQFVPDEKSNLIDMTNEDDEDEMLFKNSHPSPPARFLDGLRILMDSSPSNASPPDADGLENPPIVLENSNSADFDATAYPKAKQDGLDKALTAKKVAGKSFSHVQQRHGRPAR